MVHKSIGALAVFSAIGLSLITPIPSQGVTYLSNLAEPVAVEFTSNGTFAHATGFWTGANPVRLTSITVSVLTNSTGSSELRLRADAGGAGVPGALIESLGSQTLPASSGSVLVTYNSPGTPVLLPYSLYWVTLGETGSGSFYWDGTSSTTSPGADPSPYGWGTGDFVKVSSNGGASWQDVDFGPPNENAKFAVDGTATGPLLDLTVTDELNRSIFRVSQTTGNRTILSGCANLACSAIVGSGPEFQQPIGLIHRADDSLVTSDATGRAVMRVDPANGNRTVLSGCANGACSSIIGAGTNLVSPNDVAAAGSSLLVSDSRDDNFHGIVLTVDPVSGNRTTLSGCVDDPCSSQVGSGRALKGPVGIIRTAAGQIFVVDRGSPESPLPAAVVSIDPITGDRTVVSGCIDALCTASAGSGPLLVVPNPGAVAADGHLLVVDVSLGAVLRIDRVTGNRSVVSGCNNAVACGGAPVGSGPALSSPMAVKVAASGDLLVTDAGLPGVMRVDPATGNRTVITSASMGTGPSFQEPAVPVDLGVLVGPPPDADNDGIPDSLDKCMLDSRNANPGMDCDTDCDGYGNVCDGDFNQNGTTASTDFSMFFVPSLNTGIPSSRGTDMNCSGTVNSTDFSKFFAPKLNSGAGGGPSGLSCAGQPGCGC
jgi:hypothetical protein